MAIHPIIQFLEWLGCASFAASGAFAAVRSRFDIMGVVVVGTVTGIGGGVPRDFLVGQLPAIDSAGSFLSVASVMLLTCMARRHNDANVLCLGGRTTGPEVALDCLEIFLKTEFEGGCHARRVDKLSHPSF